MRQRHRQWLAAMALSTMPASTNSFSSGVTPTTKQLVTSLPEQRRTVLDVPNMFLSSQSPFTTAISPTSDRFGGRSSPDNDDDRILGFDTSLYDLKSSSVDSQKWNAGRAFEESLESPFLKRSSLPWFPWIPSRSQIETLKLSELKQACGERGLKKSGLKAELQERLWDWSRQEQIQRVAERRDTAMDMGLGLSDVYSTDSSSTDTEDDGISLSDVYSTDDSSSSSSTKKDDDSPALKANSLAEWSRDGVDQLLSRRKAIHREKRMGKTQKKAPPSKPKPQDYRSYLTKAFEAPSSTSNNRQVKELYRAAKAADQAGDRQASKTLLMRLKEMTPHDGRVWRRLARMEVEDGRDEEARAILQEGLRILPDNAHLWHGLGQIGVSTEKSRLCYQKAIAADPSLPHPYHALGTMEHTQGRIADAMKVLKKGVRACPTNHRLHHALGDIYREAKLLQMAEKSYRRALEYGPKVSHCFAYTALAFCAYEQGNVDDCRHWLRKSVSLNNGRHSQGWVALAQMEEAQDNIDAARAVCIGAISQYERGLLRKRIKTDPMEFQYSNPMAMKETLFRTVPQYRSGDKFVNVFRNWARLEQKYGYPETVDEVYTRASFAFPYDWKLAVNWAQYHASVHNEDRATELFDKACKIAKNRHADPYRIYAEYEMSFENYEEAREILFRGARAMSASSDGGLGNRGGMAELYHTWAVCEWHLCNLSRAETLFDHALRLTDSGDDGSKLRSFILYSIARLKYYSGEYELAQHCIALCLKENLMPGGNSKIWELWADVALAAGNEQLSRQCAEQAASIKKEERDKGAEDLARMGGAGLSKMVGASTQPLMRRDPWHDKLFGSKNSASSGFFNGVELPTREIDVEEEQPDSQPSLETSL